jgi:hypothetical protein
VAGEPVGAEMADGVVQQFQYPRVGSWLVNLGQALAGPREIALFQYPRVGSWLVNPPSFLAVNCAFRVVLGRFVTSPETLNRRPPRKTILVPQGL